MADINDHDAASKLDNRTGIFLEPYSSVPSINDHNSNNNVSADTTVKEYQTLSDVDNKHVFQSPLSQFCRLIDTADISMIGSDKLSGATNKNVTLSQLSSSPFHQDLFDDVTKNNDGAAQPLVPLAFDAMTDLMATADDTSLAQHAVENLPAANSKPSDLDQTWELFSQAGLQQWEVHSDALLQPANELVSPMKTPVLNPTSGYMADNNPWADTSLSGWGSMADDTAITETPHRNSSSVANDNLLMTPVNISAAQLTSTPAHNSEAANQYSEKLAVNSSTSSASRRRYQSAGRTFSRSFSRSYVYNCAALSKGPYCSRHTDRTAATKSKAGNQCHFECGSDDGFPPLAQPAAKHIYGPVSTFLQHNSTDNDDGGNCMVVISSAQTTPHTNSLVVSTKHNHLTHTLVDQFQDSGIEITATVPSTPVANRNVPMYHSTPTRCSQTPQPSQHPNNTSLYMAPAVPVRPIPRYAIQNRPIIPKAKKKQPKHKPPVQLLGSQRPKLAPQVYSLLQPDSGKIGQPQVPLPPSAAPFAVPALQAPTRVPVIGQPMVVLPHQQSAPHPPLPTPRAHHLAPLPPYSLMNRRPLQRQTVVDQAAQTPCYQPPLPPDPVSPQPLSVQIKSLRHVLSSLSEFYSSENTLMRNLCNCYEQKAAEMEMIRHAYLMRLPSVEPMLKAVNDHFDTEHKKLVQWSFTQATLVVQLMDRAQEQHQDAQAIEHMALRVMIPPAQEGDWFPGTMSHALAPPAGQEDNQVIIVQSNRQMQSSEQPEAENHNSNITAADVQRTSSSTDLHPPPALQRRPHFAPQQHIVGYALIDNRPSGFQNMIKPLSVEKARQHDQEHSKQTFLNAHRFKSTNNAPSNSSLDRFKSTNNAPSITSLDLEDLGFSNSPRNVCSMFDVSSFNLSLSPKSTPVVNVADSTTADDLAIVIQPEHLDMDQGYVQPQKLSSAEATDCTTSSNSEEKHQYYFPYLNRDWLLGSMNIKGNLKKKKLMKLAVKILEKWYENNCLHPYPTPETATVLAQACNLTVEQVRKWMANKRLRSGNTKKICELAAALRLKKVAKVFAQIAGGNISSSTMHKLRPSIYIKQVKRDIERKEQKARLKSEHVVKTTFRKQESAERVEWSARSDGSRVIVHKCDDDSSVQMFDVPGNNTHDKSKTIVKKKDDEKGCNVDLTARDIDDVDVKEQCNKCCEINDKLNILSKNGIRLNMKSEQLEKLTVVASAKDLSIKSSSWKKENAERKMRAKKDQDSYQLRWDGSLRSRQATGKKRPPLRDKNDNSENVAVDLARENSQREVYDKRVDQNHVVADKEKQISRNHGITADNSVLENEKVIATNTNNAVKEEMKTDGAKDELFLNCGFECLLDSPEDTHTAEHDISSLDLSFVDDI